VLGGWKGELTIEGDVLTVKPREGGKHISDVRPRAALARLQVPRIRGRDFLA
jgi:hypothetical protein